MMMRYFGASTAALAEVIARGGVNTFSARIVFAFGMPGADVVARAICLSHLSGKDANAAAASGRGGQLKHEGAFRATRCCRR
jgi:hypothetical protein